MDEEISMTKRIIYGIMTAIVFIGLVAIAYNYFQIELTWKQTVKGFANEIRLGNSYYGEDRTSKLIFLLQENGFESYSVKAFALKGFCVIELDENVYSLSNKLKLKVFNECLQPVSYVKVVAYDGNYFVEPVTGEYAPMPLARGERKAIIIKEEVK